MNDLAGQDLLLDDNKIYLKWEYIIYSINSSKKYNNKIKNLTKTLCKLWNKQLIKLSNINIK